MEFAEQYAAPTEAILGPLYPRRNEFKELFYLRWGRIRFRVDWGAEMNVKVVLKVFHEDGTFEQYLAHTDPCGGNWNQHWRETRDFFIQRIMLVKQTREVVVVLAQFVNQITVFM